MITKRFADEDVEVDPDIFEEIKQTIRGIPEEYHQKRLRFGKLVREVEAKGYSLHQAWMIVTIAHREVREERSE